ncbi:hypothetical protein DEJ28_00120 [Curtobacterium sp. MCPF17_002]|uniref:Ig-like domain-containing protein n=1 Tax=Curtobacterium sp. MCPF17_002 TaxID=2175645 RepID=UPI000DA7AD83|nr:hypothetical protein [Curtobacterium sp. MCPF17_002]WIB77535.1 hypothetical protein DEJ28_00120 [Curtobacterium sp. MCPF17_002]
MPDAARSSCPPALRIGGAALVAALVTAGAVVGLPQSASAAEPFSKTMLYGATSGPSGSEGVVAINRTNGSYERKIPVPSGATSSINQLGLAVDGKTVFFTDSANVYEYDVTGDSVSKTTRYGSLPTNMGGVDPKSGRYWYGGNVSNNDAQLQFTSYDPSDHANTKAVVTVNASNFTGTNGDLAFDGQGNMYFVKSDTQTKNAQIFRVDAMDLAASQTASAEKVGDVIAAGTGLTSMAFGDDGYLYVAGSGTNAFLKVNPITGDVVQRSNVGAALLDLASNALPYTGSVSVERPTTTFDPDDQFTVTLTGNGVTKNNSATTTSTTPTATAGPLLLLPDQPEPYTITQTPASSSTNPVNYTTTWLCKDPATGKAVIDGAGTTGTFTIPAGVASVDCSFTNAVKPKPVATTDAAPVSQPGQAVTVDVVGNDSGDLLPASLRITDPDGKDVTALHVPGQGDWSVDTATGSITFVPEQDFTGDPTPVDYTVRDSRGLRTGAKVVVTYLPTAADDSAAGTPQGTSAVVDVTANDSANVDPTTVQLLNASGDPVRSLPVAGQGTWSVSSSTGKVTFAPASGSTGNPAPVEYTVGDGAGHTVRATITVGYATAARADDARDNTIGAPVAVDVTGNDSANVDPRTVRLRGADGSAVTTLVVPGEGTWTVDADTGVVTFTPERGYTGNPAPVEYTVDDGQGHSSTASVQVGYTPTAADDATVAPTIGEPVTVDVLANDSAGIERTSVTLSDEDDNATRTLVVDGEGTWTVAADTGEITFTPEDGFTGNPTAIRYNAGDAFENGVTAAVAVSYLPKAAADRSTGNALGSPVEVDVTANDSANVVASTVRLVDGAALVTELTVAGQGTWSVDTTSGHLTFTPVAGFRGDPTPVSYSAQDAAGHATTAAVSVGFTPVATKDVSGRNTLGTAVTVDVLGNDSTNVDPRTLRLLDGDGDPVTELAVRGQGTWTVDTTTGKVTFTPESGFTGNPTAVRYSVQDDRGDTTTAELEVGYLPGAVDDVTSGHALGGPVTVDVTANDSTNTDAASVRLLDTDRTPRTEVTVAEQGTWTVEATTGAVTFTPIAGFTGNPTPIRYTASDAAGDATTALVTVTFLPAAVDDSSLGHAVGASATVDVTANDSRNVDPTTVRLLEADGSAVTSMTVDDEGTWTVDTTTGRNTFVPEAGFTGNPSTVEYRVADASGDTVTAAVEVGYQDAVAVTPTPTPADPTPSPADTTPAPTATTSPAAAPAGKLAFTGAELLWPGIGGLAMLLAGGVLLLTRRRRGGRHA